MGSDDDFGDSDNNSFKLYSVDSDDYFVDGDGVPMPNGDISDKESNKSTTTTEKGGRYWAD